MSATIINTELAEATATEMVETIKTSLTEQGVYMPSQQDAFLAPIAEALGKEQVEKLHAVMDQVIDAVANHFDIDLDLVKGQARNAGLPVRPEPQPEPVVEVEVEVEVDAEEGGALAVILAKLEALDTKVTALDSLAKRHGLSA